MTSDPEATESPDQPEAETPASGVAALQAADTEIDQLVNRRERLPERDALAAATSEMKTWATTQTTMRSRLDELTDVIEKSESEAAEIRKHKERLEAQMKTVIAPREAEALMHEMATLDEQRDGIEMIELEALEEQAALDDDLTTHLGIESTHRETMSQADDVLAAVVKEIDGAVADITVRRDNARAGLADGLLARYDRVRTSSGVAVAVLTGHRCEGCHIDLSAAEVDDVKDEAAAGGGIADCPQCGRMLVV